LTRYDQSLAEFDIPSNRDLSSLRMTGGENCYKKVRSPRRAKKEILIFLGTGNPEIVEP